jgi:branched-chain amino acid transport system substrate-binding protein
MRLNRLKMCAATFVVGLLAVGCGGGTKTGSSGGTTEPYKISALLELTGSGGPTFLPAQNGARTAVAEINDAGGVYGRKLQMDMLDDQSSPDVSAAQARTAVGSNPTAIITAQGSSNFAGAVPVLQTSRIPVVSSSIYDAGLVPTPQPWYYSIVPTNPGQVTALTGATDSLLGGLKGKRVSIITAQSAALDEIVNLLTKQAGDKGFTLADVEKTELTFTSVAPQAAKIQQSKPDAVLVLGYSPTTGPIVVRDLRDAGVKTPLITQYALSSDAIFKQINDPGFYGMRVVELPDATSPLVTSAKKYGFDQGSDSTFWTLGYQMVQVVKAGLQACGKDCTATKLTDSLKTLKLKPAGAYSDYVFSATDHAGLRQVQFFHLDSTAGVKSGTNLIPVAG